MKPTEVIEGLKNLDLNLSTESDVVGLMHRFPRGGAIITKLHPGSEHNIPNLFVRASNYNPKNEAITSTDRLKYPPLKFNTGYQRASTPARPMFYAVVHKSMGEPDTISAIRTCLLETISDYDSLVSSGTRVAISLRYNIDQLKLFSIFEWDEFKSRNPKMAEVNLAFRETLLQSKPELIDNTEIILGYLAERFSIPVGEDSNLYKPSATLSQYLLDKLSGFGVDGVIFPSTKVNGQELNVALNPISSDRKLVVTKVLDCEYKPNRIVEIQSRANVAYGSKVVNFTEKVNIEIDLK